MLRLEHLQGLSEGTLSYCLWLLHHKCFLKGEHPPQLEHYLKRLLLSLSFKDCYGKNSKVASTFSTTCNLNAVACAYPMYQTLIAPNCSGEESFGKVFFLLCLYRGRTEAWIWLSASAYTYLTHELARESGSAIRTPPHTRCTLLGKETNSLTLKVLRTRSDM